jgi:hypothetical protein
MDTKEVRMRAGPDDLTIEFQQDEGDIRAARWGAMHVARYRLAPGTDLTPFFVALPDGLCSGDHYGIVLEGEITVRYKDGSTDTTRAGELYYWPEGHTGWSDHGVVFIAIAPLVQVEHMEKTLASAPG